MKKVHKGTKISGYGRYVWVTVCKDLLEDVNNVTINWKKVTCKKCLNNKI